jgi:hypothetical protein
MDFGISQSLEQTIYTLLNAIAVILWRLNAACVNISMLAYQTQDWLTGEDGGVWSVLARMTGADGIFGLNVWEAFFTLALAVYGLSRVARPFFPNAQPVEIGKLFMFGVLSYIVITRGAQLMRDLEAWRVEAGDYVYEKMAEDGGMELDVPGGSVSDEPLNPPQDLDGETPVRGWEAVSSSYFLVNNIDELQASIPPEEFRRVYCLYDPNVPINEQDEENHDGCSPQKAWDEWDELEVTLPITSVWGIELPIDVSIEYPVVQEHPENRQLGIRNAQSGVARLALGPIVALFPLVEANISLMLAMAASFIYLSLPIVLLFGFFMATESLANQLLLQLINIVIRTLILNGLIALFLMLLMGVAINGSLMTYLGLVGVGLIGGILLARFAAGTMKESMGMAFGAVSRIWTRSATATLGESARRPARLAMGAATLAGTAATMMAASRSMSWMSAPDLAEAGYEAGKRGVADIQGKPVSSSGPAIPAPVMQMAGGGSAPSAPGFSPVPTNDAGVNSASQPDLPLRWGSPQAGGQNDDAALQAHNNAPSPVAQSTPTSYGSGQGDQVQRWAEQVYQSRQPASSLGPQAGQQQAVETGRMLLGEDLSKAARAAMSRHSQQETMAVLEATRRASTQLPSGKFVRSDGRITAEGIRAVQTQLDEKTAQSFQGRPGLRDLAALVAAGVQPRKEATPDEFRQTVARAKDGQGEQAPGRTVPRSLGLDPVAAGSHFAGLNRFTRLSEQAGLTQEQRGQLLREVKQDGQVSARLRKEIETSLRRHEGGGVRMADLVKSAQALPNTLKGPMQVHLPDGNVQQTPDIVGDEAPVGKPVAGSKRGAGTKPAARPMARNKKS